MDLTHLSGTRQYGCKSFWSGFQAVWIHPRFIHPNVSMVPRRNLEDGGSRLLLLQLWLIRLSFGRRRL